MYKHKLVYYFHALRKEGFLTIFFITDWPNGIDLSTVYQDIKEKLSAEIVIKQKVELYPNMCGRTLLNLNNGIR